MEEQETKAYVFIEADGTLRGVHSWLTDDLMSFRSQKRASHVEPSSRVLRWLFYWIRKRVQDGSALAEFTRRWPCHWQARIFDGPVLGPFHSRLDAINAEIAYLNLKMKENEL